jgi:hypothetical protein
LIGSDFGRTITYVDLTAYGLGIKIGSWWAPVPFEVASSMMSMG